MVHGYVHDHRNAAVVAFVDEGFVHLLRAVVFVRGKEEGRIVPPAVVAFKFIKGHELNGIHVQTLQVIQGVGQIGDAAALQKVAD